MDTSVNKGVIYLIDNRSDRKSCFECLIREECENLLYVRYRGNINPCLYSIKEITGFRSRSGIYKKGLMVCRKILPKSLFLVSYIRNRTSYEPLKP